MREGWEVKSLGELGKVSMCKRILKKQTLPIGDIPFYKIGTFGKVPNAFISKEIYEEYRSKYSFPKKGDILLSASGTIGRRVIYDGKPAYFQDSNIVWINNDEKSVLNEYLYKFYGFCDWNPSKGATIARLYNADLRKIKIPIPPLAEQKQIVKTLDLAFKQIDQAKENLEKNLNNAKELFASKLNEVFSQRGEGWEEKRLGDVCNKNKNIKWSDNLDVEFKYVDLSAVSRESLKITNTINITSDTAPSRAKKIINELDVIFATTRPTLKRVTIIEKELDNQICSTGFVVLKSKKEIILSEIIYYFLQTEIFMNRMENLQRGASYPAVSDKDVNETIINFPVSLDIQFKIIEKLNIISKNRSKLLFHYQQKLNNLEELKKSILEKAFKGEL